MLSDCSKSVVIGCIEFTPIVLLILEGADICKTVEEMAAIGDKGEAVIVNIFKLFFDATSAAILTVGVLPDPDPIIRTSPKPLAGTEESSR